MEMRPGGRSGRGVCDFGCDSRLESTDPIESTLHDWAGQLINARVLGAILEETGGNVEYVRAGQAARFAGLLTGELTLAMQIRAATGQQALDEVVGSGMGGGVGEIWSE